MERIAKLLTEARKPLIVAGNGIRLAGERERFRAFIEHAALPFVTTWTGADLLPTDHPFNCGVLGMFGMPGANKAVFAADLILALGTHLSTPQTSTVKPWAPQAKKVVVDIDQAELGLLDADVKVCEHLREFFDYFGAAIPIDHDLDVAAYKAANKQHLQVGSYFLNHEMTRSLPEGTCMVIDGGGTALYTGFQSSYIKEGSRLICSSAMSAMGSGLPESVGACFANGRKLTTCLIGDGSMMLNLQELQTIRTHSLPIKIFILNNNGYLAIRKTQEQFQQGRYYGVGGMGRKDLEFPNYEEIAACFNIPYFRTAGAALSCESPAICEWFTDMNQPMVHQRFINGVSQPLSEMEFS